MEPSRLIATLVLGALSTLAITRADAAVLEYNRALGRAPVQTSTGWDGVAARAADGNPDGNYGAGSVTHTLYEAQPYWQIDLGGSYYIDTIELDGRTDCCRERLRDLFVMHSNQAAMAARRVSDAINEDGVEFKAIFGQADDHHVIPIGKRVRFVRIQLAGDGYLSLAEVKIVERLEVPGPAALAAQTSWIPTGVFTPASAVALAELDGSLHGAFRGSDGTLHLAPELGADLPVPGSPAISDGAPAVAIDPASNVAYVAVRGDDGWLWVGTASPAASPGAARAWSWETVARTQAAPSLIVAGGRPVLAWLDGGGIHSTWKVGPGGTWSAATDHGDALTPPSLAVNKHGAVGLAFVRRDRAVVLARGTFAGGVTWSPAETTGGWTRGTRVAVAAYGDRFFLGTLGDDGRPWVAVEQLAAPRWIGFERVADVPVLEPPTLVVFDGVVLALVRDTTLALRYWLRNPNAFARRYSAGETWLGGAVVSYFGIGATPPAVAAVGKSRVWGIWDSPAELYVATRGIGDRQLYGLNLGRFVALDVLGRFGVRVMSSPGAPGLDVKAIRNLFEHALGLLSLPTPAWATVVPSSRCRAPDDARLDVVVDPDTVGQARPGECPPRLFLNASYQHAFFLVHEWMHMDFARRGIARRAGFAAIFGNPAPKLCQRDADCGGDPCALADDDFGWFDDPTIRRWIGHKVCVADGRPQGHATFYSLQSDEHDFIEAAQLYRWGGDTLRQLARRDQDRGNPHLWNMYVWMRDNYFDGIEYSGGDGARPDKNLGDWGVPSL